MTKRRGYLFLILLLPLNIGTIERSRDTSNSSFKFMFQSSISFHLHFASMTEKEQMMQEGRNEGRESFRREEKCIEVSIIIIISSAHCVLMFAVVYVYLLFTKHTANRKGSEEK